MGLRQITEFSFASGGGQSGYIEIQGPFLLELDTIPSGATITVQHSTNDGSRWTDAAADALGNAAAYTVSRIFVLDMPVAGVRTRVSVAGSYTGNCTGRLGY